jgi:CHAD domain-containing protein
LKQRFLPPQKWLRPSLSPKARAGDAFIANMKAAVEQIKANRPGAAAAPDPEFLHQLRVGMRRLRSTLRACRPFLRRKDAGRLDRRLRAALRAFGEARDWDVFEATLGGSALRNPARERGEAARRRARATARSAQFRFLSDEALAWARGRPWRARSDAGQPMEGFARGALERAHRRLLEEAERVDWNDAPGRHRVRILLKRLRYACECFAAAWPESAMEPFLKELRRLQEILGELNDIEVQRRLLAQIAGAEAARQVRARLGRLAERERSLLLRLRRAWPAFALVSPYWRAPEAVPVGG